MDNNFINLNELLSQVNWETVTEESSGFEDLPEGFYLCSVEKAELKPNKDNTNMQVSMQLKITSPGLKEDIDDRGYSKLVEIPGTLNRKVFKHYPLKDLNSIKRFVQDMIKFEGAEPGQPLLEKEYFMTEEIIPDALAMLIGSQIYVQATKREYQGKVNTWYDLLSWDRASALGLPV